MVPVLLTMVSCGGGASARENQFKAAYYLSDGWELQSSAKLQGSAVERGKTISTPGYKPENWYKTNAPSTVLAALVKNNVYKDLYFGKNIEKVDKEQFKTSWWYRKEFHLDKPGPASGNTHLIFEGINYKANVWLNGKAVATSDTMEGSFRMFDYDVTGTVRAGKNVLAVEIIPPKKGDLTIGFVDWNPTPPDNNMGLWRGVKIKRTGTVTMNHIFVQPKVDTESPDMALKQAWLAISADLTNHSRETVTGRVEGKIENIVFSQPYTLNPGETRKVVFEPAKYPELHIKNPRLWWPHTIGSPELYSMDIDVTVDKLVSDQSRVRFGIREVSDYMTEDGHRGYKINGQKIVIRGAAWVDDLMLADTPRHVESQMRYVRHMNLNTIRLEGFWGNSSLLYDLADEYGIMIMVGLSCQWEWEEYCGLPADFYMCVATPEDIHLQARAYRDQVWWLRNHPSIFVWVYGSDKLPRPEFEKKLNQYVKNEDPTRPILGACKHKVYSDKVPLRINDTFKYYDSPISGPTGIKMLGAWDVVPPMYWYTDTEFGGAYGFNSETGPGPQPPPLESLKKMIPADRLWPINDYWDFHCGRNEFNTIKRWLKVFDNRYGKSGSVEEFCFNAQIANYELMRPMYEAFSVNKFKATGVIGWMLNSAWPEMYWQLYDYYLMPSGAFYGARNANRPLNIIYNYGDKNIYLSNDFMEAKENLWAEIRVVDISGKTVFEKILAGNTAVHIAGNGSAKILDMPKLENVSKTYFLDLKLKDQTGQLIADNFYWLSTEADVMDYPATIWLHTPMKGYADFSALNSLKKIQIKSTHRFETSKDGKTRTVRVTLENPGNTVAFFIEMKVAGEKSGFTILPVFWSDNYVSLLPGEKKEFTAEFNTSDLNGDKPVFLFSGYNVK